MPYGPRTRLIRGMYWTSSIKCIYYIQSFVLESMLVKVVKVNYALIVECGTFMIANLMATEGSLKTVRSMLVGSKTFIRDIVRVWDSVRSTKRALVRDIMLAGDSTLLKDIALTGEDALIWNYTFVRDIAVVRDTTLTKDIVHLLAGNNARIRNSVIIRKLRCHDTQIKN